MSVASGQRLAEERWTLTSRNSTGERLVHALLFTSALITVSLTLGLILFTINESFPFFLSEGFSFLEFFTGSTWQPVVQQFGALPVLTSTFLTVAIAMLFAMPVGVAFAVVLSQYVSDRVRAWVKPTLEVISGIPTIVYGFFALYYVTPALRAIFGASVVSTYNTFSAGLTMGVLVLPVVTSLADDAFSGVPPHLREAPLSVGATRAEAFRKVVLPASSSGLISVFVVALSRTIGESIIVSLAAGSGPNLTLNPFESAETATGYILRIARGEARPGTPDYTSIFALGLVLFVLTFSLNLLARWLQQRARGRLAPRGVTL